jgi:hypothetical protein
MSRGGPVRVWRLSCVERTLIVEWINNFCALNNLLQYTKKRDHGHGKFFSNTPPMYEATMAGLPKHILSQALGWYAY